MKYHLYKLEINYIKKMEGDIRVLIKINNNVKIIISIIISILLYFQYISKQYQY